jgi:hypothetical protein
MNLSTATPVVAPGVTSMRLCGNYNAEADRRTQERRETNINALHETNSESMAGEPGVWVHGRPLEDRERGDLATFIP